MMLLTLLSLLFVIKAQICQRGGYVLDTSSSCFTSASYNLENCCFVCPVTNTTGYYEMCGSLYDLGYANCNDPLALAAMQASCTGISGDPGAASFGCQCNAGTNTSQLTGLTPTAIPTASSTSLPTTAPTNDAPRFTILAAGQLFVLTLLVVYY